MRIIDNEIDFSKVHADDVFIDAIGAAEPERHDGFVDDYLVSLLLACRHDVDSEPIHDPVTPALALATVRAAIARRRRGACA